MSRMAWWTLAPSCRVKPTPCREASRLGSADDCSTTDRQGISVVPPPQVDPHPQPPSTRVRRIVLQATRGLRISSCEISTPRAGGFASRG